LSALNAARGGAKHDSASTARARKYTLLAQP